MWSASQACQTTFFDPKPSFADRNAVSIMSHAIQDVTCLPYLLHKLFIQQSPDVLPPHGLLQSMHEMSAGVGWGTRHI